MPKRLYKFLLLMSIIIVTIDVSSIASADDTAIGRYLTVKNKPKAEQVDLLSQTIQMHFPQNVQTIGDAVNYLLRLSGYSLITADHQENALKTTLSKPLPAVDREFGPMTLKDALSTLAGPAFYLIQDPLNRTINFRVKAQYTSFCVTPSKSKNNSRD